jgi:hypothetical protein
MTMTKSINSQSNADEYEANQHNSILMYFSITTIVVVTKSDLFNLTGANPYA